MHLKTRLFLASLPILPIVLLSSSAQAFNPEQLAQFLQTKQCQNCDLSNAPLDRLNLSGANLQGANLSNAMLTGTNLSNANLQGANVQSANLNDAYLYRANLSGTNFSNAKLQKAYLRETTLINTDFSRADLQSVDLQGNNLGQALFPGSNLSGANLSQTIGITIVSTRVGTRQSPLSDLAPHFICFTPVANHSRVPNLDDLYKSAEMSGFKIQTTDFTGVNMTDTNLENSVLMNSNFSNVDLTGANLRSACLLRAKFTGAKLDRTNWTATRLMETEIPSGDIKGAISLVPQRAAALRNRELTSRLNTGSLNRAQQAYYLENDRFTTSIEATGMGIKPDTEDYRYRLFVAPDRYPAAMQVALPKTSDLVTFLGLVYAPKFDGQSATIAKLCVSEKPGTPMPLWSAIDYKNPKKGEPIACPFGFTPVK
jgi:uncharacterized protein YjbI with pentapeptide repeats